MVLFLGYFHEAFNFNYCIPLISALGNYFKMGYQGEAITNSFNFMLIHCGNCMLNMSLLIKIPSNCVLHTFWPILSALKGNEGLDGNFQ